MSLFTWWLKQYFKVSEWVVSWYGPGGTDLEKGYGDVQPWRPPFHASPAVRKGPISSKRVCSQDPFWENLEILASTASISPKFFALKPQIWKFSAHKPPNWESFSSQAPPPPFQGQISVRKPHTSEIRAAHPYLKKSWVTSPPPDMGHGVI